MEERSVEGLRSLVRFDDNRDCLRGVVPLRNLVCLGVRLRPSTLTGKVPVLTPGGRPGRLEVD